MSIPNTRWRIPPAAWVPIALAVVAEAFSNALRAYGLGSHLEAYTVAIGTFRISLAGAVLVLAAVVVSLSQSRAAWVALTPMAPARQRIVAGIAAALLLAISAGSMASHILEAQRAKSGDERTGRTSYGIAKAAYDTAKADHDRLAGARSTEEVRAAMDKVRVPGWAWTDTKQCTADKSGMSRDEAKACQPILDLRVEMARAIERAKVSEKMAEAEAKLAELHPPAEATLDEALLAHWWSWLMGAGVVLVATFGSVLFARVEPVHTGAVRVGKSPTPIVPKVATPASGRRSRRGATSKDASVVAFVEAYRRAHGRDPHPRELQAKFGLPRSTAQRYAMTGRQLPAALRVIK